MVGLSVAAKRPDLLHAYIGMGQIIHIRGNGRVGMAWTLKRAREKGDAEAIRAIEALRPYPDSGPFTIEKADGWRKYSIRYGRSEERRVGKRVSVRVDLGGRRIIKKQHI